MAYILPLLKGDPEPSRQVPFGIDNKQRHFPHVKSVQHLDQRTAAKIVSHVELGEEADTQPTEAQPRARLAVALALY